MVAMASLFFVARSRRCGKPSALRIRCASIRLRLVNTTSVRVGRELKDELSKGGYLEDPCATLEGIAELRWLLRDEGIDMPMASNVAVTCFEQVAEAQRLGAVQVVVRSALLGRRA